MWVSVDVDISVGMTRIVSSWFGSWYVLYCVASLLRSRFLCANRRSRCVGMAYVVPSQTVETGDSKLSMRGIFSTGRVFFDIDVDRRKLTKG